MEMRVTDTEWQFIRRYLSELPAPKHVGRPRASDRELFERIVWVLNTGIQWSALPDEYPAKSSCHKRFQVWSADGSWTRLRKALVLRLKKKRRLGLQEGFIDGSFIKAKKGGPVWRYLATTEEKRAPS
jgi:transposase